MHKLFGEILVEAGKITKEQVEEGLKLQKYNPQRKLGEILVTLNYIKYEDIVETLKFQYKLNGKTPPGIEKWLSQEEIDRIINSVK
jgi:type IV pilus assembly protein PilB